MRNIIIVAVFDSGLRCYKNAVDAIKDEGPATHLKIMFRGGG
jgi:hypothetical protein